MTLNELLQSFNAINDYTRLGHMIKDVTTFQPENDDEYHAMYLWKEFLKTFFQDKYSAYITADTIKKVLDASDEIYNPEKLERAAAFLRNKLKPAQVITDDWLIFFIRRFR